MKLSDNFVCFLQDIKQAEWGLPIPALGAWLLELNIDPVDVVLEIRRFIGDPAGTCFRKDCCLTVRENDQGELTLWASNFDLEDLGWWPLHSDREARLRAQNIKLPFEKTCLEDILVSQQGRNLVLQLVVADAARPSTETRLSIWVRLGTTECVVNENNA